ncbi:Arv1-like family-domain-containing protein [Rhodocollybia butyracea]|uniref:Protein ARV n=1 Tax=Rhodocollybia butyracea TaxID=206335 RepID=A0A9P5PQN9_9AGAR|nr:Arv1-like family-domain-containing protein [Rhodocollybia butyracea]
MPVCTTCTHWLPFLYTVYQSDYNLRLEQCPNCHSFAADPYVELDGLNILIELMLLRRAVYIHLLYNRGSEPRREDGTNDNTRKSEIEIQKKAMKKERNSWQLVLRLGLILTTIDAFIRWSQLNSMSRAFSPWAIETLSGFVRILVGSCIGIILAYYAVLRVFNKRPKSDISGEFRVAYGSPSSHGIIYLFITTNIFLFLLTIWRPSRSQTNIEYPVFSESIHVVLNALEVTTDDLDREWTEWTVRNVLGGMSAGFGLRVIMDVHPVAATFVIVFGWFVKTRVSRLVLASGWIGQNVTSPEAWLASSIP